MSPLPAVKTDEIVDYINAIARSGSFPSAFELARLEHMIAPLSKSDHAVFHAFRGAFFALKGDCARSRVCHETSLTIAPKRSYLYHLYAVSLAYMGERVEAITMEEKTLELGGPDIHAISGVILNAYFLNDYALLNAWLPKYEGLAGKPHEVAEWLIEDAEDEAEIPAIREESEREGWISLEDLKEELGL